MILSVLLTVGLPLLLIIVLIVIKPLDRLTWSLLVVGLGLAVVAGYLIGLWLALPWWTPVLLALLGIVAAIASRPDETDGGVPDVVRFTLMGFSVLLIGASTWAIASAITARVPPEGFVADLATPLGPGHYLVVNGGADTATNAHMAMLDAGNEHARGQAYGLDIIALDGPFQFRANGFAPPVPEDYAIFGTPVLAPCRGVVVDVVVDQPDNRVGEVDMEPVTGNAVSLRCGVAHILLAHLREGSVTVRLGQRVAPGDVLGEVGNSGNSGEPHLHIHAQRPPVNGDHPRDADPLPMTIDGRFLARNDRLTIAP